MENDRTVLFRQRVKLRWRINKSFPKLVGLLKNGKKVANAKAEAHNDFTPVRMITSTNL